MNVWYLVGAILLLLANGFFVGAEFALVAARQSKVETLAEEGNRRARLAQASMRELTLTLAGAQLGITMCSLGLGFVAEPAVAHLLESAATTFFDPPEAALHAVSFAVALSIVTFLHMVLGEIAPKNIAIAEPEKSALWIAVPFRTFIAIFRPIIWALNGLANLGVRAVGVEPQVERVSAHSIREIKDMIVASADEGLLPESERRLLEGAAAFGERDCTAVMVPRTELVAISATMTPAEIEGVVIASGHSRLPVYGQSLDEIYGLVHVKDLLKTDDRNRHRPLNRKLIRPMLVVPESLNIHPLLVRMRKERKHFALVVDEHGGTAGIVTLEDLLEELVGEIRDEYDVSEFGIEIVGDQRYVVPGTLRIDEAKERLDVTLPEGEYETVAGFLMDRLGRVPKRHDVVEHEAWRLSVRTMHRRRVVEVLIEKQEVSSSSRT